MVKRKRQNKANSPTAPKRVAADERRRNAVAMRAKGHTYREIADALGYSSEPTAYNAVKSMLAKVNTAAVDDFRRLQMARYERMLQAHWDMALAGSDKSAKVVLDTMAAMNRLMGAEAPTKTEVSGPDGGPVPLSPVLAGMSDEDLAERIQQLEVAVRAQLAKPVKQA